ncbi:MFS transporter [Kocuria sabuli]|uniref:MFS transporter n=1 Tax=Kocuria sabuli TaxID=3071448 RepID=UPI0034D3B425
MTAPSAPARRSTGMGTAVAGMLLIAATYGMARFGVGLFAPYLAVQRPELVGVLGWAAGAQFTSYSLAAVVAARLVDRSPRTGLALAGSTATTGCVGVAVTSDPVVFVAAVFIGGMGGGFASPALVPIIDAVVAPEATSTAQSVANTGTAVGVVAAGLLVSAVPSVGPAWLVMALVCAVATAAVWHRVRARTDLVAPQTPASGPASAPSRRAWRPLLVPGTAALLAGAGSSLIWTFGPLLLTDTGAVAAERVGWLWIALGLGGLLGTLTGTLVERTGRRGGWCTCAGALTLAGAGVALCVTTGGSWAAYTSMALFGAGYMGLTTVLILWARHVWPHHAGAGTSVLFVALATGQALGSVGFGVAQALLHPVLLATLAASLCAAGGLTALVGRR